MEVGREEERPSASSEAAGKWQTILKLHQESPDFLFNFKRNPLSENILKCSPVFVKVFFSLLLKC